MEKILYVFGGVLIVCGFIFGIAVINGAYYEYENYIGFVYIFSGIISGVFFIGLGKVIELLESIDSTIIDFKFKFFREIKK